MMNVRNNVAVGAGAVVLATIGMVAVGSLPLLADLTMATLLFAGLAYVAFTAQSRRFDDESRLVYRPVYVRSRNIHRQVRSLDD